MKQYFQSILFLLTCCLPCFGFAEDRTVLVSVAPYVEIVQDIGGKSIHPLLVVPPNASFHAFEPTPKQILAMSKGKVWFCIGEPFENKVINALKNQNKDLLIVDLRDGLALLTNEECCHHEHHAHSSFDPHIWTSPKMMQTQAKTIALGLEKAFPELKDEIQKNLKVVLQKLEALDKDIREILKDAKGLTILVSHPALGYFCFENMT